MNDAATFRPCLGDAGLSRCGTYRYWLTRIWDDARPTDSWLMLNPSTADASRDDPTIRRCIRFSGGWGAGGIVVLNLFAFRATDPAMLPPVRRAAVGPRQDACIRRHVAGRRVICAWGCRGTLHGRDRAVIRLLRDAACGEIVSLGSTKAGHPRHPLYVPASTGPVAFGFGCDA